MGRLHGIATAMAVVITLSATTHFSVNTVVSWPCTINPALGGTSAVTCAQGPNVDDPALVSYVADSGNGDMIMTVEF
jgi:hypothetical protein